MKKQKIIPSLMMMGLMMVVSPSTFNVSASSGYGGGSGTQSDPYLILTPEHLNQLQLDVNVNKIDTTGKYYQLTTDIDLSGYDNDSDETNGNFTPIGSSSSIAFKGTFDGNGKVISNLEIIMPEQNYVGLFGYQYSGTIQGVGLENVVIEGKQNIGGLVGYQKNSSSKISESYAVGEVSGNESVGGLVGYKTGGTVSQSYAMGNVSGSSNVGGLVGYKTGGTISQSYAMGNVSGSEDVGGLVGEQSGGTIAQSYTTGDVRGNDYVGGLVGYQGVIYSPKINQSYSTGSVSGSGNSIGGLVGATASSAVVENSYWDIESSGQSSSKGGVPVRTEGIATGLVYRILDGFDFRNTWILCEGESPKLRWQVDSCQEVEPIELLFKGDGTEENPYLISSPEDLTYMSKMVDIGGIIPYRYFELAKDINLLDYDMDQDINNGNLLPIGGLEIPFKGKFDGNGFVISNVKIVLPEQNYVGLFGYADSTAIQNLGLENILIEGKDYVGGLIGYQSSGTISESYVTGEVSGDGDYVGGLVGYQKNSSSKIDESYATGNISGNNYVGGLIGYQSSGAISGSYATGEVSGNDYVGGLVGYQSSGTISESYVTGDIKGSQNVGGLIGYQSSGTISKSYVTGEVSGDGDYVGGLVGYQTGGTINQSYATGSVSGSSKIGGLVGYKTGSSSKISESYATGSVSGSGSEDVGGLVGYKTGGTVSQSYATGNVSGSEDVGGLVGEQGGGTISESYATGDVRGNDYVGGLVGYQGVIYSPKINQSYSTGSVSGSGNSIGGLVGATASSAVVENSYWNIETTGQSSSQGGTGLSTKQMTKRKAKDNMVGFDFDAVWQESNGYPLLHWQTPNPISGEESDLTINGTIEATILSLTIPSDSMSFILNPNEEVGKQFIASDFELINGSQAPLTLEIKSFEQVTDVLNDVEPTKYGDWNGLNKTQSKDIALALVPKIGEGWLTLNEGNRYVANLGETNIGTIKGNSTVSFDFEAKHGSSFTETLTPQYKLTFVFGLQD